MDTEEVEASFEDYKQQWLAEVVEGSPSTVELGRRFALKIITDYFNLSEEPDSDALYYCDGSRDGGIDIAYLERGSEFEQMLEGVDEANVSATTGGTWYLVQSKYGKSYQGTSTLFDEGRKVLDTLDGSRTSLSSLSQEVVNRLVAFRQSAGEKDRIVLLFATIDPLTDDASEKALKDLRAIAKNRIGGVVEVESISLESLYDQVSVKDTPATATVPITGHLVQSGDLLAGLISLPAMYEFLRAYKQEVGELEKLYEKNVRSYLQRRRKVNSKIEATLLYEPERFGLYNNGITIVVQDFYYENDVYVLADPFIVNGCQTTSTIFKIFTDKVDSGATGIPVSQRPWFQSTEKGNVIVKIVKVSSQDNALLKNITTYTNTQNVISDKDFLALNPKLQRWVKDMKEYNIFLEIQKGSWDAQLAKQRNKTRGIKFTPDQYANAFELLKVYGAGWLGVPGTAWHQNNSFLPPDGKTFNEILDTPKDERDFSADDLRAAFNLQKIAYEYRFAHRATRDSRRVTRFLFYFVVVHLLKQIKGHNPLRQDVTQALLALSKPENTQAQSHLMDASIGVIDDYLDSSLSNSVYEEETYNGNINTFLKSPHLGRNLSETPYLAEHLRFAISILSRSASGQTTKPIDEIRAAIKP